MKLWRDRLAVLAFVIRSRLLPAVRAEVPPASAGLLPRLSSPAGRATLSFSEIALRRGMAKTLREIDARNLFIPSSSPVCRAADTALLFCVAVFGLAAAVIAVLRQVVE